MTDWKNESPEWCDVCNCFITEENCNCCGPKGCNSDTTSNEPGGINNFNFPGKPGNRVGTHGWVLEGILTQIQTEQGFTVEEQPDYISLCLAGTAVARFGTNADPAEIRRAADEVLNK